MQSAVLPVLLLPVALAALCPCPPAPPSPVCGSDGRTYSNECQLQCAGLSVAHPGPCKSTGVHAGRRRRHTVEFKEYNKCHTQCGEPHWGNCTECGAGDEKCRKLCNWNCGCRCMGLPTGGLDEETHDLWEMCLEKRGCAKCDCDIRSQPCSNSCRMQRARCGCGCFQRVTDTRTSTAIATTASSTPSAIELETNSTKAITSARGATATVGWTWRNYTTCVEQSHNCGRDSTFLPEVRRANCTCGCMGLPGGDLEVYGSAVVQRCLSDCGALSSKKECQKDECHDNCYLRELRCRCECNHRGRATAATSTDSKLNN